VSGVPARNHQSAQLPPSTTRAGSIGNSAYTELTMAVEANQNSFYVYLDEDAGLNHGFPSGAFSGYGAAQVTIDTGCIDDPADTNLGCYPSTNTTALDQVHGTVLRITFPPESGSQYTGLNIEEPQNWGQLNYECQCGVTTTCNPYNLTGATTIEFDARSPDGITLQFGVGSVPSGGCATTTLTNLPASTTYTHMSLSLGPPDLACTPNLSSANVLFFVVTNAARAPNGGTVLLDNIKFTPFPPRTSQGSETLSLPLSTQTYGVVPQTSNFPPDQVNRNVATVYEASLTLLSLLYRGQSGDLTDAQEIANALDYALYHDNHGDFIPTAPAATAGCFGGTPALQCGLHNSYEDGDIGLLNQQTSPGAGLAGDVRLAGFTVPTSPPGFDLVLDGATGGNNAFATIALLAAYRQFNNVTYLNDAIAIANWIADLSDTSGMGYGGYFQGYPDAGKPKVLQIQKSTENNADIFAAFTLLAEIEAGLGNTAAAAQWEASANTAGSFVLQMYDSVNGRFNTGTVPKGTSPGPGVCPTGPLQGNDVINVCDFLDADSFSILALSGSRADGLYSPTKGDWQPAMLYVLNLPPPLSFTQTITANGLSFSGFDLVPTPPATGIAWEFTGQSVETCNYLDAIFGVNTFGSCGQTYIAQIAQAQSSAPFADGSSLVAATLNGESTPPSNFPPGSEYLYTPFQNIPERLGLAATNWAIFADLGVNPHAFFPRVVLSNNSLTFAPQLLGTMSAPQSVTLTNSGSETLNISSLLPEGANPGDFASSDNCNGSVAPGASCTISVTFTPTATGTRSATITVTDNAPAITQTFSLTGTGISPAATFSPASVAFGDVLIHTTSIVKKVFLTSSGTANLTISGIEITGANAADFSETNTCTAASYAPGAKCSISVKFTPSLLAPESATLTVTDNATNSPQTVALSGTGVPPVGLSPTSLSFGNVYEGVSSAAKTITLTNYQKETLTGISVGITGSADYTQTNTCGTSIDAGKTCKITVTFKPSLIGTDDATLSVSDSASNSPQTAVLTGKGLIPVKLTPASETYPSQTVGTTSPAKLFTLTSYLTTTITNIVITPSGDFTVFSTTCGTTLAAKGKCTIDVVFKPTATGTRTGTLSVSDSAVNSPQTSTLTGTGK
jgi:hypothetical protein